MMETPPVRCVERPRTAAFVQVVESLPQDARAPAARARIQLGKYAQQRRTGGRSATPEELPHPSQTTQLAIQPILPDGPVRHVARHSGRAGIDTRWR